MEFGVLEAMSMTRIGIEMEMGKCQTLAQHEAVHAGNHPVGSSIGHECRDGNLAESIIGTCRLLALL
jgi:hypothetical protein